MSYEGPGCCNRVVRRPPSTSRGLFSDTGHPMRPGARSATGSGLVRSETSDTHSPAESSQLVAQLDFERRRFGRMRRVLLTAGRLLVDQWKGSRHKWWMVTLTYRDDTEWRAGDISGLTKAMRAWLARRDLDARYVWCLESKERLSGARIGQQRPHYHLLVQLPFGVSMPKPDRQGWWKHGLTQCVVARRAVGYLAKYASKAGCALAQFRGARSYGVSGLRASHRAVLSFWRAPRWVRSAYRFCDPLGTLPETEVHTPVRRVRGGFLWGQTGELVRSPVVAKFIGGVLCFLPREQSCAA